MFHMFSIRLHLKCICRDHEVKGLRDKWESTLSATEITLDEETLKKLDEIRILVAPILRESLPTLAEGVRDLLLPFLRLFREASAFAPSVLRRHYPHGEHHYAGADRDKPAAQPPNLSIAVSFRLTPRL